MSHLAPAATEQKYWLLISDKRKQEYKTYNIHNKTLLAIHYNKCNTKINKYQWNYQRKSEWNEMRTMSRIKMIESGNFGTVQWQRIVISHDQLK